MARRFDELREIRALELEAEARRKALRDADDDEAKARRRDYQARTDARIREAIEPIPGVTYGCIGNEERWGDDRAWFLFLPHPGRAGQPKDRIGGYPTEQRTRLLNDAKVLRAGFDLANGDYHR